MKYLYTALFFFFFFNTSYTQVEEIIFQKEIEGVSFHKYSERYDIYAEKDKNKFKYKSPEDVLQVEISTTSQIIMNNIYLKKDKARELRVREQERRGTMIIPLNFYTLHHKLEFDHKGVKTVVLQYELTIDGKPIFGKKNYYAKVLQQHNRKWLIVKDYDYELKRIVNVIRRIKSDILENLLYKLPEENDDIRFLKKQCRGLNLRGLDINCIYELRNRWLVERWHDKEIERLLKYYFHS